MINESKYIINKRTNLNEYFNHQNIILVSIAKYWTNTLIFTGPDFTIFSDNPF